ncbi:AbrB/MazE/SpoVT family DNA-binding domain-containing protein [Patescibacteria group bacterium]|nr:AbrB/MazE/SpoVT family DNA-binding domain-containing protein [Patescibacteria group bacterium]
MVEVAVTKLSSKGQIVLPSEMRRDMSVGERLLIIRSRGQLILKRIKNIDSNFKRDLEFANRVEQAWRAYDRGEFKSLSADKFLKELEKC